MKIKNLIIILVMFAIGTAVAEYVPFKVKLNVLERLVIGELLPKETSFANWKIINDLKQQLAPTEEELKAINARPTEDGQIIADWNAVPEKEIVFGEVTEKFIVDALKKMDAESKLLPEHISVYEKFVIRGKPE